MNNHPFLGALWLKDQGYQLADDPLFDTRYAQPNFLFPPPPFLPKQTYSFITLGVEEEFRNVFTVSQDGHLRHWGLGNIGQRYYVYAF